MGDVEAVGGIIVYGVIFSCLHQLQKKAVLFNALALFLWHDGFYVLFCELHAACIALVCSCVHDVFYHGLHALSVSSYNGQHRSV